MKLSTLLFIAGSLSITNTGIALAQGPVSINGYALNAQQLQSLEIQLGTRIQPGNYLVNMNNGCWTNMSTGTSGCYSGKPGQSFSRYGSGEWDGQGNWSHYSNTTGTDGFSVGGTSDGCLYAGDWSNC